MVSLVPCLIVAGNRVTGWLGAPIAKYFLPALLVPSSRMSREVKVAVHCWVIAATLRHPDTGTAAQVSCSSNWSLTVAKER